MKPHLKATINAFSIFLINNIFFSSNEMTFKFKHISAKATCFALLSRLKSNNNYMCYEYFPHSCLRSR